MPVSCIWKPQQSPYISSKSGGVVIFGYPLATQENKKACKLATYRVLFVLEAGLEPAQPLLAKGF